MFGGLCIQVAYLGMAVPLSVSISLKGCARRAPPMLSLWSIRA